MMQGHILKFLSKDDAKIRSGKLCQPSQTYGHSIQTPDWFKRKFSLPAKGGYQYKFDDPKFKEKFKYASQINCFTIINFNKDIVNPQNNRNSLLNNRKKGLLSDYLDHNGWMKTVVPLTGRERGLQARRLNNAERERNIETIKAQKSIYIASKTANNFYSTKKNQFQANSKNRQIFTSQFQRNNLQNQMNNQKSQRLQNKQSQIVKNRKIINFKKYQIGEKDRIKSARNDLALNKIHNIQKISIDDSMKHNKIKKIDSQFVKNMMIVTAREWGRGRTISPAKTIEKFQNLISKDGSKEIKKIRFRN